MAVQVAVPSTKRVNHRVDSMAYAADVSIDGHTTVDIPACPAASTNGVMNLQSIANAGTFPPSTAFAPASLSRYGRNLVVVASGAATSNVTIIGYDYLGQGMKESFTLAGTTPVVGKKMFADVVGATCGATAGTTVSIGWGNKLGVPYKVLGTAMTGELTNDVTPTAGTLVAGVPVQTLTSDDPRGSYTPNQVPDGNKSYRFTCTVDRSNLHGSVQAVV